MTARRLAIPRRDRHTRPLLAHGAVGMLGFVLTCVAVTRAGQTSTGDDARRDPALAGTMAASISLYAVVLLVGALASDEQGETRVARRRARRRAPRRSGVPRQLRSSAARKGFRYAGSRGTTPR